MMRGMLAGILLAGVLLGTVLTVEAGESTAPFDLSLRWGDTGLTLEGRVAGPLGPASGRVTGRLRRGGVTIDGWLDDRGHTRIFELDANVLDGVFRAVVRDSPMGI